MLRIEKRTKIIRKLFNKNTSESLTYAALEARILIEQICYERLRNSHDYISHDDLKKWQPKYIIDTLIEEVDGDIASTLTFSISKKPIQSHKAELSQQDYEEVEYQKIGTQIGFDPKKLGKLWNALSSFLHVSLPRTKEDATNAYGEKVKLRKKIAEALTELSRIGEGTLIVSGLGDTVSFTCGCGSLNKRRKALLKEKQIVNCINPDCPERYEATFENSKINFYRKEITVECQKCAEPISFPEKVMLELDLNMTIKFDCKNCTEMNFFKWRLFQVKTLPQNPTT